MAGEKNDIGKAKQIGKRFLLSRRRLDTLDSQVSRCLPKWRIRQVHTTAGLRAMPGCRRGW